MAVQCPNCGGYKVDEETIRRNPKGGARDSVGTFLLVIAVASLFLQGIVGEWIVWMSWGVFLLWFTLKYVSTLSWPRVSYRTCKLCGYSWTHEPGQPGPEVHVRPDLIQKGMQKLEEEEKERRRQEEAAYWLHQQMKK